MICVNRDTRTFKSAHNLQTDEDQANPCAENHALGIEASNWEAEKSLMGPDLCAKCGEHELLASRPALNIPQQDLLLQTIFSRTSNDFTDWNPL